MRAVIIGNGEISDYKFTYDLLKEDDFIICADGGYRHAKILHKAPDILIGDMDSLGENDYNGKTVILPVRKDYTDSEVCIKYVIENKYDEVLMLGFTGTRLDHTLTNLSLLKQLTNIKCCIVNEHNEVYYIQSGTHEFYGKKGDILSIIPFGDNIYSVTTEGLEYPLTNENLIFGESRGVSNVFCSRKCTVTIKSGSALIIKSKD